MEILISPAGLTLIFCGLAFFLIGLVQGVLIPVHRNTRMALSAHLAAVQCGMAIMIVGVIWSLVVLSSFWKNTALISFIAGNGLIWFGISIAAITGASKALPIAGEGYSSSRFGEMSVLVFEGAGAALTLLSTGLVLFGLGRTIFS